MNFAQGILVILLTVFISVGSIAQSSIMLDNEVVEVNTTRQQDIDLFRNGMSMLSASLDSGISEEWALWLNKLVKVAAVEIKRTEMNLKELNDGDIDDLKKWQEEKYPGKDVNVKLEIQLLTNRLKSEKYLYNRMDTWDVNNLSDSRQSQALRGTMNSFKRNMEKNLKYGDGTIKSSKPSTGGQVESGTGFVVKKEKADTKGEMDPHMKNYLESKEMRKESYQKTLTQLKNTIDDADDKPAKKAFRSLVEIMNNELNANNWFLSMITSGAIKNSGVNANTLSATINKQQSILEQANKLRPTTDSSLSKSKTEVLNVANGFVTTF